MVDATTKMVIPAILFAGIVAIYAMYKNAEERRINPFAPKNLLDKDMNLPVIWLYYDTSDVNARWWSDFGDRSSRVLNIPFLNLCYETIAMQNKGKYRLEVIGGLADLAVRLGGWTALPSKLQNPLASVREGELNWIRAAVLARFGGLWLSPSSICFKGFGSLPAERLVFWGTDQSESFAGKRGTRAPSLNACWSPIPEHPIWVQWAERSKLRLDSSNGGTNARDDQKGDFVELCEGKQEVEVRVSDELDRKGVSGRRLELEDYLAAGGEGQTHFQVPASAVFTTMPWPEMKNRRAFGWFLRMSEEQILASDLVIRNLLK